MRSINNRVCFNIISCASITLDINRIVFITNNITFFINRNCDIITIFINSTLRITQSMIRVSVGLEHIDDLKADLALGLDTLTV